MSYWSITGDPFPGRQCVWDQVLLEATQDGSRFQDPRVRRVDKVPSLLGAEDMEILCGRLFRSGTRFSDYFWFSKKDNAWLQEPFMLLNLAEALKSMGAPPKAHAE